MSGVDKNRKRNRIVNFRVSEEELIKIENKILLSGLSKSEYLISSVLKEPMMIYVGTFESDRLSLVFEKLNNILERVPEFSQKEINKLLFECKDLVSEILKINKE